MGGDWNRDDVILFVRNPASPVARTSADGRAPVDVTKLEAGHAGHAFPHFLPDGRHFLYYVVAGPEARGIYAGQVDGTPPKRLLDADGGAVYTNGHLLFLRQTKVFAQAFDAERLELQGSPFEVADGALGRSTSFALTLSAGAGAVAFRAATARIGKQFAWFGRSGNPIETVDDVLEALTMALSLSPDGSRLVFFQRGENASDLWLLETRRGVRSRFTNHPAEDIFPVWSRDGRYIVFRSNRNGGWALYQKRTTGTDPEELLLNAVRDETFAIDTSPDGQWLLYQQRNEKTGWDILALSRRGDAKPVPVIQTDADERGGLLSPDGKWLAYVANTSGPLEVYVQAFPGPGPKIQVSTKGGDSIRWRSNGRELFYIALDGKLMAAPIQVVADGKSIDVGTPVPLFTTRMGRTISSAEYVVSDDGQRFLMNTVVQDAGRTPLRVILNWKAQPSSR